MLSLTLALLLLTLLVLLPRLMLVLLWHLAVLLGGLIHLVMLRLFAAGFTALLAVLFLGALLLSGGIGS